MAKFLMLYYFDAIQMIYAQGLADLPVRRHVIRASPRWQCVVAALTIGLGITSNRVRADTDEEPEEANLRVGLAGEYRDAHGKVARRVDSTVAFVWSERPPDRRLARGAFSARWRGQLLVPSPGSYELSVYLVGRVKISLKGEVLIDETSDRPAWVNSQPVELPFGWHPLEIVYSKTRPTARISLFWSGPKFSREPISERWLGHDPRLSPPERFERGRLLVRAFRCDACHRIAGHTRSIPGPALDQLTGNISKTWLVAWLTDDHGRVDQDGSGSADARSRRMPFWGLPKEDATAIASYLLSTGRPETDLDASQVAPSPSGDAGAGERLMMTRGCLACHRVGRLGTSGLFSGGDLSAIASKRPAGFFVNWLTNPAALNRHHRMPLFDWKSPEANDLAAYLGTLKGSGDPGRVSLPLPEKRDIARGHELVRQHHCIACHAMPGTEATSMVPEKIPLNKIPDWNNACTGKPDMLKNRPGYRLGDVDVQALQEYVAKFERADVKTPLIDGRDVLTERQCLACHARGVLPGIATHIAAVAEAHPELASQLPAMTPPSLNSVGDKLRKASLRAAIERSSDRLRPWLEVRMPKFRLSDGELQALVHYFVRTDRLPAAATISAKKEPNPASPDPPAPDATSLVAAGRRLVTTDGFGCTSCHPIGGVVPPPGPLAARGPNLAEMGRRIRQPWFDRWMHDPGRIVPRIEMPAVQIPVRGVLHDQLDQQLAAVWHVLNLPDFEPPRPGALRVARRHNHPEVDESARVFTDLLETDGHTFVKPLLVALSNRHNVLFDLTSSRLAAWWSGDTAHQRLRGKYWYWEAAGTPIVAASQGEAELAIIRSEQRELPQVDPLLPPSFDHLWFVPNGVQFVTRLPFVNGQDKAGAAKTVLTVTQTVTREESAMGAESASGFRRTVKVSGVPASAAVQLRTLPGAELQLGSDRRSAWSAGSSSYRLQLVTPEIRFESGDGAPVTLPPSQHGETSIEIVYLSQRQVDRFVSQQSPGEPIQAEPLDVVPGFETIRMPLPGHIMPTGFAWRRDGQLIFTSLEGRVWQATDQAADGSQLRLQDLGVELAAPYGIAVVPLPGGREAIDVCDYTALLRLYDSDSDPRIDRIETLVDGWGHSTDYHRWVVGLPRDEKGNYYVALPQREDGPPSHLQGCALRLVPRATTTESPRKYRLELIASGFRFPNGIACDRFGTPLVTDNQGNYTPFNELNEIVDGTHYGYISPHDAVEQALQPKQSPAVAIPHPWVRSVNGICFLETPPALRTRNGGRWFGPWEGHLIGCEFETRQLVRISLERVGGMYQGAAYPLSVSPPAVQPTFLGPIVCAVAPNGDLYVGSVRDSAWGLGSNLGEIVRLRFQQSKLPKGISEIRALSDGFIVEMTAPVDRRQAADVDNYLLASYRRVATPDYGGPDVDRRRERITAVEVFPKGDPDVNRVKIKLNELREGFVYEFRLKNLFGKGEPLHPAEAYYTLRKIPGVATNSDGG